MEKYAILKESNKNNGESECTLVGKAVYEWIRRMMFYSHFDLTDLLIETMATVFKKDLGFKNFVADNIFINFFRKTYNLPIDNTKTLDIGYHQGHSVQIKDILSYLRNYCVSSTMDDDVVEQGPSCSIKQIDNEIKIAEELPTLTDVDFCHSSSIKQDDNDVEIIDEPSTFSVMRIGILDKTSPLPLVLSPAISLANLPENHELYYMAEESVPPEPTVKVSLGAAVKSHDDAMNCIRRLEEFALLKENFRLIGLIARLEDDLKDGQ